MSIVLETARLRLRRFRCDDVDLLVELDSDPEVMRYITGGKPSSREEIRDVVMPRLLGYYARWPHYGTFVAQRRDAGEFLGWFALRPHQGHPDDQPELGYRLRRAAWGKGYATEGSLALVDWAFSALGARRVIAETMSVNERSRRVMHRAGLRLVRTWHEQWDDPIAGSEEGEVEYAIERAEWLAEHRRGCATTGGGRDAR